MNDFERCNKVSGVYWLKAPVENLQVHIELKPPDDILSLPRFEDFTSESESINIQPNIEQHAFKWQEKVFSTWEIQHYSDKLNCVTDTELKYHETIKNNEITPTKVFTYIQEDYHVPLPYEFKNKSISKLESCMEFLNLNETVGSIGRVFGSKTDSMSHLLKSQNSLCGEEKWIAMHIVFDNADDNEETLILKQESILLSIFLNTTQNYVLLAPDVNDLELNPYTIDTADIKYGITVDFGEMGGGDELETLLTRLYSKWEKKHKILVNFIMPVLGRTQYYVTIDLMSAEGFEMDNIYIEYTIKLPEGLQCSDTLHGRTHTSESISEEHKDVWNFGHIIELCLEAEGSIDDPIKFYLEAISIDRQCNHRTEGYSHHTIPLRPGLQHHELVCLRPEEKSWRADKRRFFVGGCNLIRDLDVLSKNDGLNSNFVYTTTGKIHMSYSIISQTSSSNLGPDSGGAPSSGSSALLLGAEAALNKYKKARARLAAATKDLRGLGSGDS